MTAPPRPRGRGGQAFVVGFGMPAGLEIVGPLRGSHAFDPPWTPWFLWRDLVIAQVADPMG